MINELINKQITVPLYRYEQLIEDSMKYTQIFEEIYRYNKENEYTTFLKLIDYEKYMDLLNNGKVSNLESEGNND